jgi:protein-L-isoaspartate(D-aspartate) O-methyltransferase
MDVSQAGEQDIPALHQALVDKQVEAENITSARVEAAFRAVPRHLFLPGVPLEVVYRDQAITTKYLNGTPISSSSQPAIMAIMLEQLQLERGQRVLEIGAGTGYNAALMAHIVGTQGKVVTIDIDDDTVANARRNLAAAGYERVQVLCADGGLGYPDAAPYDRIILTVASQDIVPAWREQLKRDGRLLLPLSIRGSQVAIAFEQVGEYLQSTSVQGCGFMMLRGDFGEHGSHTQGGPERGLHLECNEGRSMDMDGVYRLLTGPAQDIPLNISVTFQEMFFQLNTWLALHEPDFCRLTIEDELVERGILPNPFLPSSNKKLISTVGLFGEAALCVLVCFPAQNVSENNSALSPSPQWFVRSFGSNDVLAYRLLAQVRAWNAAGRPALEKLSIRVYPQNTSYIPTTHEILIPKRWTNLVCTWQR